MILKNINGTARLFSPTTPFAFTARYNSSKQNRHQDFRQKKQKHRQLRSEMFLLCFCFYLTISFKEEIIYSTCSSVSSVERQRNLVFIHLVAFGIVGNVKAALLYAESKGSGL